MNSKKPTIGSLKFHERSRALNRLNQLSMYTDLVKTILAETHIMKYATNTLFPIGWLHVLNLLSD